MSITKHKEKIIIFAFLTLTLAFFGGFGLQHLTKFVTADEHYWIYERVPQYWKAWVKPDLEKTFINDKPGVTVALFSSPALLFEKNPEKYINKIDTDLDRYDTEKMEKLLLAFRLPILFFCGLSLLYLFWIIQKISNQWIALWTIILAGLSPIILGISQIINPDAFLWIFSTAALFSFFALLKYDQKKFLFLTAIFTGLGMLTKYSINILFPFYLFLVVFYYFYEKQSTEDIQHYFKKNIKHFSIIVLGSLGTVAFFMPAIIVKPIYFYRMTLGVKSTGIMWLIIGVFFIFLAIDTFKLKNKLLLGCKKIYTKIEKYIAYIPIIILVIFVILIIGRAIFGTWPLFVNTPFDLKNIDDSKIVQNLFEKILLEFNPLVFSLTPIVLFLSSFALISAKSGTTKKYNFLIIAISFFILAYYSSFLVANILSTARYSIIIFPLFSFLAAIGITEIIEKSKTQILLLLNSGISLFLIIFSASTLYFAKPFYFNYVSPLLSKDQTVTDAWGFGGYEAVEYLKKLPNAENLTIWSDYYGVCEFFPGKCITDYQFDKEKYTIDYYVLTRRGRIKYNPFFNSRLGKRENFSQAFKYYDRTNPVWEMTIGNRPENFIKIFEADKDLHSTIVTDIDHCPSRSPISNDQLRSLINFSQEKGSDFMISLGDNGSHRLGDCSDTADRDMRFIANELRSSQIPVRFILGDHDIKSSTNSYQNWVEATQKDTTYYSFNEKGFHIIILDTVLGGEPMAASCEEDIECSELEDKLKELKHISFGEYQQKYTDSKNTLEKEALSLNSKLDAKKYSISLTRAWDIRDQGRLSDTELSWLESDLKATASSKILVFSHEPIFKFFSGSKTHNIIGGEKAREILNKSGKEIVAISGDAHVWHEEKQGNIQYYIIDQFKNKNGSWAYFTWDNNGFRLEKETH
jgi:4-amino-4-deoxy-L-arabinose transferase-like glycosyltransferase